MITKCLSGAITGAAGYLVNVEVDLSQGLPSFDIVGLPDSGVKESKDRVRAALNNSGYDFPVKRIIVNLAPADTRKEGPSFDLPIAAGILACLGIIPYERAQTMFFTGELSLDGSVRPVSGVLPMIHGAFECGVTECVVPAANAREAALVSGVKIYPIESINELIERFRDGSFTPCVFDGDNSGDNTAPGAELDFSDVKGQDSVKRALTVAAAGAHNMLIIGPPGSGKTMMAKRLPTILPPLTFEESIEVTKIYSVAGLTDERNSLIKTRPFRAPHHTISYAALTGGGRIPKPGEISLAHNGILFLDELPEFQKNVLEVLRQPLEDRKITVSRAGGSVTYLSSFMLVASMNPCPCGNLGNPEKCFCTTGEISKYQGKVSGPLLDRIDIQAEAPAVNYSDLSYKAQAVSSAQLRELVQNARSIQKERYADEGIMCNSELNSRQVLKYCTLGAAENQLLKQAFDNIGLSARAYHKILKLARTIADLDRAESITATHLAEAVSYRSLDRNAW